MKAQYMVLNKIREEEDLRFDEFYDFRVVKSEEYYYIQREYMVPGYDSNGIYNPCITTSWYTLIDYKKCFSRSRAISNEILQRTEKDKFKKFEHLKDILNFWKNSPVDQILQSGFYEKSDILGHTTFATTRNQLMIDYPEALI